MPSLAAPAGALQPAPSTPSVKVATTSTKIKKLPSQKSVTRSQPKDLVGTLTGDPVVKLPIAGTAVATLLGSTGFVPVGDLPIAVQAGQITSPAAVTVTSLSQDLLAKVGGQGLGFQVTRDDGGSTSLPVQVQVDYSGFKFAYGANWAARLQVWKLPACVIQKPTDAACRTGVQVAGVANDLAGDKLDIPAVAEPDPNLLGGLIPPSPTPSPSATLSPTPDASASPGSSPNPSDSVSPSAASTDSPTPTDSPSPALDPSASPLTSTSPAPSDSVASPSPSPSPTGANSPHISIGLTTQVASVYVLAGGSSSSAGNYGASPLAGSGTWSVGLQSGSFQYNVPVTAPPAIGGATPSIGFAYDSGGVDGRSSAKNTQGSWAGLGWDVNPGFIQRDYANCSVTAPTKGISDLCWPTVTGAESNMTLNFQGHTGLLFQSGTSNEWRLQNDPGWRVIHQTSAVAGQLGPNGTEQGEYWIVVTPDGTKYYFGLGTDGPTGTTFTNSVWNVPVVATAAGQRCYNATLLSSWCQQAWRWNLDYVVDPHQNVTDYFYTKEGNYYSLEGNTAGVPYTRDGYLAHIDYGLTASAPNAQAPARIAFTAGSRCTIRILNRTMVCPGVTTANASSYPDTPTDQVCTGTCISAQNTPTFWTALDLEQIQTQWFNTAVYVPVDTWTTSFSFPTPPDGAQLRFS